MKMVTGGISMPPKVPTLPLWLMPAARYPARKAAWSVANVRPNTLGMTGS